MPRLYVNFIPKKIFSRIFFSKPVLYLVGWLAHVLMKLLYFSLRITVKGHEALLIASKEPLIIALWHDQLLLGPLVFGQLPKSTFAVCISNSRDGHLLASFIETFSNATTILIGHKNRHGALLQMMQAVGNKEILLITPDGPRGPKHEVKAGVIFSAQQTAAPIVAMRCHATSSWQLKTWDRLSIPKPFSKVTITFEPSLACPKETSRIVLQNELCDALFDPVVESLLSKKVS